MHSSPPSPLRDPFGPTADPAAYVPRTATEVALLRLELALRENRGPVTLSGGDGAGKTLLLHILAQRLDGAFHTLYVPYPKLAPAELCAWLLAALGGSASRDPESALHERITRDIESGFPPLLFMFDDAGRMPAESLRCLQALWSDTAGYLHILLVRSEDDPIESFSWEGVLPRDVALEGRMEPREAARYVRTRLDRASVDAALRAQLERELGRLHAQTQGIPGRLHCAATEILCHAPAFQRHPTGAGDRGRFPSSRTPPRCTRQGGAS